ncbi:uncharacterized protein LOC126645812 [Myiozetetes cayanensis]|uniref:uncharacterized protein LOC126645812 n=1 Tax=Myiozetetes cayanensis TaxID=478635 RepID=UPI00215E48AE|nr:uncharacterized protein LOC126645812 [Myiozetetes cayanensis]
MDGDREGSAVSPGSVCPARAVGWLWWPRLYLVGLCAGVVFLVVPGQAVYRCCVPGSLYWHHVPGATCVAGWAVCTGTTFWVHLSRCRVWHTWGQPHVSVVQHPEGSGKRTPSPATSCRDVLLELLPALTHQCPTSTSPELPWLFCLEEPGEIAALCGGVASHQHPHGTAILTQHHCDIVLCLSGPHPAPQGGCLPVPPRSLVTLLPIPRTVFGETVVAWSRSSPASPRIRSLHDPSMTLWGLDTAMTNASAACHVPRHQHLPWPQFVPCPWTPASPWPHSVPCPWTPASPAPLCAMSLDSRISLAPLCAVSLDSRISLAPLCAVSLDSSIS